MRHSRTFGSTAQCFAHEMSRRVGEPPVITRRCGSGSKASHRPEDRAAGKRQFAEPLRSRATSSARQSQTMALVETNLAPHEAGVADLTKALTSALVPTPQQAPINASV